jgi:beta-lactamase regulating signal transducer with metallopeptidase domain
MNTIVEHINSAGFSFVEFAVPMLVQSCVLIVILLLADLLLRKKVKAVFRYWIWMLVLLKLVLPTSLSSPLSLGYLFGDKLTYQDLAETTSALEFTDPVPTDNPPGISPIYIQSNVYTPPTMSNPSVVEPTAAERASPPAPVTPLSWQGVVFLVWLAVVIAMGLLLLQRALFVRGLVAQAKQAGRLMKDELAYCCASMGIKCRVGLKVSPNATTPSVCGLIRPVILVPWNLVSTLGASRLRTVLMHELAHIKRADLWVNLWLANCVIRRIREQAVDEAVLVAMGEKAQKYPQTLVDVAKMAFKRPALSLRLIGVVESKSALAGRIKHILGRPMPKSAKLGLISILAIIIAGAVLLPMAKAQRQPEPETSVEAGPLDHFVGKYAVAGHPDTAVFEITKKGDVFIIKDMRGPVFEVIEAKDGFVFSNNNDERFRIWCDASEDSYYLDILGVEGKGWEPESGRLIKISTEKTADETDVQVEGDGGKTAKSYRKRYFATLVVTDDGAIFKGQKLTWEQVREKLKAVPDRQITTLEVAVDPAIVPDNLRGSAMLKWVSQSTGFQKVAQLRQDLGFEYITLVWIELVPDAGRYRFVSKMRFDLASRYLLP